MRFFQLLHLYKCHLKLGSNPDLGLIFDSSPSLPTHVPSEDPTTSNVRLTGVQFLQTHTHLPLSPPYCSNYPALVP